MVPTRGPKAEDGTAFWRPKAAPKRSKNASATQPRFFIDLGSILGAILIRRTPPGWRACQIIRIFRYNRYNQVSTAPPTPPARPKNQSKICENPPLENKCVFLASNFGFNFRIPLFLVFFGFWMDFGSHFGCILASFSIRRTPPGWRACQTIRIYWYRPVYA